MLELTINDKNVQAADGETVLAVCRANRIPVPTLCHHEAVEPHGACRLCMVEITHPDWRGWSGLVTSCLYPVEPGLVVKTNSPKVQEVRRTVLDLLLAQAPGAKPVQAFARSLGVRQSSYPTADPDNLCIMCALCVRVCTAVGAAAIATQGRGATKYIGTPFDLEPEACIGCLSCAHICPTGHIQFEETATERVIWKRRFELLRCSGCGKTLITAAQRDHLAAQTGLGPDYFEQCEQCKRTAVAERFATVGTGSEA